MNGVAAPKPHLHLLRAAGRRLAKPIVFLLGLHVIGTAGYLIIGGPRYSVLDGLYMTFITIATIGYGEVIDLSGSPLGRVFTMVLGFAGIANTWVIMSVLTAMLIEGDIHNALKRRRMQNTIDKLTGHHIVCGLGRVGANVALELARTERPYVAIDTDTSRAEICREGDPDLLYLHGDAAEDHVLLAAGLERAAGVFAITGDDAKNLVITLSAKQINPAIRVVARCHEVAYIDKMRRVGADAIVSPDFNGGMSIVASMVRPQVATFMEDMAHADRNYRVEEFAVPATLSGTAVSGLDPRGPNHLLLAVRGAGQWHYNPSDDYAVRTGDVLLYMVTPAGRKHLLQRLGV